MARLTKNNSSLWGSNPPSPSDRNKQKFYEYYRAGLLDESKITNDGWKSLYEHELEKGYASPEDIPSNVSSKYGIDTSIGRSNQSDFGFDEPSYIEPTIETKEKESLFDKISSFFGNIGNDSIPKYKQDFDTNTLPKPSTNLGDLLPKKPTVDTEFNSSAWNSVIEQKNQGLGLKPNFGNKSLVENDDPLLMALNSKIDPKFIGEHTKQVMNTINTNRFNKQMQEQAQLDQFGVRNPYLPDGSINPNGSIAIPQERARVDNASQPFLSDGTLNPYGDIVNDPTTENSFKSGLYGAYEKFIGNTARRLEGEANIPLLVRGGVDYQTAQNAINQRDVEREYWTEDRMFNAFLGKSHDAEITKNESTAREIGGFAGNLGKMLLFSQVLGPATTTKGMIAKNAGLGALSRAEGSYSRGEDSETIVKDALIGAGSFAIGELAGIGVTNKLTNQLIHTFKTQPQWANHLTALVRSARGVTDGTVGTLSEVALSNVMGKETEIGLKDAIQSGLIMGIVNGVTSYIPWGRLNVSEQEMKSFNIKVDEVDGEFLKTNGYIKLSDIDGVNTNNPYINDIYINPNTKDIVVSATRDGAFLVPTSMVQDTLDIQTLDMINRIQDTPIRQDVDFKAQPDFIDKATDPNKYSKVLNKFMENEGYKLQSMDGQQVYAKYNKLNTVEGDWDIVPISKAEQKFDNEYFTRHKNTQGPRVEASPRTEQATIGRFDDSYEVNRAAMDTTGKQWVRDMQDKGYSEYKPGVWVKEVDGNIVDIVPEFTVGKGGKPIPVFDIKDGETNTSRIGVKGFSGGEYDIDKGATKQANPYVEQAQKDSKALIEKAINDPDLKGNKQYEKFVENVVNMEYNLKMLDDAGDTNKGLDDFLKKDSVKNSLKLYKDFIDDKNINKDELINNMRKFNNEFERLTGMADVSSPAIKSATREMVDNAENEMINDSETEMPLDDLENDEDIEGVNSGDIVNYKGHNYVVDKLDGDKVEIIGADPNYSEKLTVDISEVNSGKLVKEYKEGDTIQFTSSSGETLRGTIRSVNDDEVSVKVTNNLSEVGGVPIGRVEYVKTENIQNVDLNEASQSPTSNLNDVDKQMVQGDTETIVEGQQASTREGNVQVGNTIEYQSGNKVHSGIIVRIDGDRIFIKNNIDDFVTKDIHKNSIVGIKDDIATPESSAMDLEDTIDETIETKTEVGSTDASFELNGFKVGDKVFEKSIPTNKGTIVGFYNDTAKVKSDETGQITFYSHSLLESYNADNQAEKELREKMLKDSTRIDSLSLFLEEMPSEELTPEYILEQAKSIAEQYNSDGNMHYDELNDDNLVIRKKAISDKRKIDNFVKRFESMVGETKPTEEDISNINESTISDKVISTIPETKVKDKYNIVRIGNTDANLKPSTIPQGLYVSIPDNIDDFDSPHNVGNVKYIGTAKPKNTLMVEDTKIEHARFGASKEGYGSAGVIALKTLVGDDEFNKLLKLNKNEMTDLLNRVYPNHDYTRYYDSYELLEAYAGLLSRDKGYDSILLEDKEFPELSELVILKDNIMEIMHTKLIGEQASSEPQEQSESTIRPTGQEEDEKPTEKPVEAEKDTIEPSTINGVEKDVIEPNEGINDTKKPTLADYGIQIIDTTTKNGTEIWHIKGDTYEYKDILGKNGMKAIPYGKGRNFVWSFKKSQYLTKEELENAILKEILGVEKRYKDTIETILDKLPDDWEDDFFKEKKIKEDIYNIIDNSSLAEEYFRRFKDEYGKGVWNTVSLNVNAQEIENKVEIVNGGVSDDNRTNDAKTDNREQLKGNEQREVQKTEEEQRTGRVPGLEGRTDKREDRSGEGTTKTNDAGVRGTTTERSGESSDKRIAGEVAGNFRITDEITLHEGGKKTRYKNNVAAIKLVKQLDIEGRKATLEEQKVLAKYVGWGGITEAFYDDEPKWANEYKELKELLTEEEYRFARESRLNAHYTAREIIDKMYQAVKRLGFKNGKILEPAVGSGNFFGLLPEEFFNSQLHAVELEPITGKIATHLYPDAKVNIMGYENYKVPNNYFDLIISNVPFGNFKVNDKDYNHLKFSIHNYFFAKSLDKVKEGGIVAFVTSGFTMDSKDESVREHINSKAELLGAIRLPNNSFSENAGTEVTTDIIFLRKLKQGETSNNKWLSMGEIDGVPVNEYYVDNPDMLLGTMVFAQNMYGSEDSTALVADVDDISDVFNSAISNLPENVFDVSTKFVEVEKVTTIGDFQLGKYDKVGSIVLRDNKAYQVLDDRLEPITQNKTIEKNGVKTKVEVPLEGKRIDRIKGMIQVKEALRETIDAQLKDLPDSEINKAIKNLNVVYDAFVKGNGYINDNANKLAFRTDADYQRIASLEKWDAKTKKYAKSDVFFKRTIEVAKRVVKADNAIDGLGVVLNEDGYVDVDRIAELTSKTSEEVIKNLRGLIYKNPKTKTYQTKDEYLSGNVKDKLRIAKAYAKEEPEYTENVEALEAVIPEDVPAKDIDTKFGQPWIDDTIIQDFTNTLLEDDNQSIKVKYIPTTGDWVVEGKTVNRAIATNKFGIPRMSAEDIIENLLNSREVRVNVYVGTGDDRKIDKKSSRVETAKALEKSKLIIKEFKDYIFADQDRRKYLVDKYNELFNNTVLRSYDGSFLTFNGMSENIRGKFRGYQKSAVARIVFSGNTLLAHTVGAGKTFEMIAGAMELKRLGLANKPMFVVPNHLIGQWENSFYQLYPNANILAATKNDFTKENRKRLFSMISNNNYDAVIVAHSSFGRIPVSKETEIEFINMEINDVEQAIIASKEADGKGSRVTKQLEKTLKTLRTNLEIMNDKPQDNVVTFEELGVDYLFVDEAHNFKNLFFYTKMSRIAGVQNSKAKRATDMYMKTRLVSRLHNNKRGIVFATGTPVSNSIAEMFTMQRYLQLETLQEIGVSHFDTWANMFGDTVTKPEVDKTGKGFKMKTRFTDYVNVPELKKLFRSFADIINQDDLKRFLQEEGLGVNALPEMDGGKPITVQAEPSEQLVDYIEELVARSEAVELGKVEPTEDNALKITNDGRVSALDMRLIDGSYDDDPNSKLNLAIANVFKEYQDGNKDKTTQLVFSDLGTPKKQKTKEQKLKTRKVVRANGYETYQWYYDKENEKKYVVVKIDKENEEIYKLFEDGDEAMDSLEDNNTDRKTIAPYNFDVDIDDYIDSLGGDETDFEVKFDIYNDIREKLVSMGVPRNEIAFIHEANTDVAKEKMFDKVRKGEIRILLGSTAKMGEGMNVQDRLIALHHLDAPWKPSAIEQRNGRIIRFGNMHKNIRVYQYVTKGSFDAYIWSMLERKATFISKIMDSDFSTRKYTDAFDPVVLNASEVKALASNDPRILEKFEVDKDVEELQNLKHSHRAEQYDIQDKISRNQRTLDKSDSLLADLKTDIKSVVNLKGDNFKVVIGGKTYDTRKEAGQALMDALEKLDNFVEEEVGAFGGFKLSLYRTGAENKGILRGKGKYEIQLSTSPSGNITRLENLLNEPERRLNEANRLIERAKKEIITYKEQLGKPFAREDELEKILKRQAELDNELSLDRPEESTEVEEAEVINNASSNTSSTRSSIPNNATRDIPNGERKRTKKIKPISEIIKDIEQDFETSVSSKRYRGGRGAIGQYQTHSESIRVKTDNNIQTIAHELGHHFDKKYNLSTKYSSFINIMEDGLSLSDDYKPEEIPGEVIAEFIRLYLVTDNQAYELSPDFYNAFMETLDNKDLKNLNKHKEDILNWYASDLMERGQSTIRSHTEKKKSSTKDKLTNLEMFVFDDLAPIRMFSETVEEYTGQKLNFRQHPYVLAMQSRRAGMMAKSQIIYAQTDAEGNVIGESFKELLKDIPKEKMKAFDDYLKVSHAITLNEYGKQVYSDDFTIEDMQLMKTTYELDNPQFADIAQGVYEWWNRFVEEWVVKQGFLAPEVWADLKERYPTYVPNFRYIGEENYGSQARRGFGNQNSPIKRMKGSAKDTYSVIESLLIYTDKIVKTQKRNEVGLAVHDLYLQVEGLGDTLTKITHENQLNKYNAQDLKISLTTQLITDYIDQLTGADKDKANKLADNGEYEELMEFLTSKGFAGAEIVDNTIDDIITFFTPRMFSTDRGVYTVIDKAGKTHFYEVHDPLFLEAMLNLSDKSMDKVTRLIGAWKRMFTNLTTGANPIFGVTSNIWGDVPQAFIYGNYKNPLEFGVDLAKSTKDIFTGNEKAEAYYAMGGGMSSPISENRQLMTEMLNKLFPDMKKSGVKSMVDYMIGQIEQFNDTIESAPRLTEFTKVMEEHGDSYEGRLRAIYEASELTTNFLRHGRMQYTIIGQGVPFLNAGLQGMYKLHQEYINRRGARRNDLTGDGGRKKDNKRLAGIMLKALLSITIFEILQMIAYQDDEEYNKLAEYLKDGYWLIKYDDGKFIRIKKPRAEGMIFGSMFRRGFRQGIGDKEAWEGFADNFINTFLPPNPATDNIFAGLIGVGRNKTWSGNPIVPVRLQNLPPLEQYDISTSSISKAVSQVLNKATGIETSPKNIDYLIQQYTGIIGQVLLPATTETTTVGGAIARKMTTDLAFSNKVVNEFYENKEKLDSAYTLYNQKGTKSKDFDPVLRYRYNQVSSDMSDIWKEINSIKEDTNLSLKEKQTKERELRLDLLEITNPENLKPTSYDEFKVLYNKGQDMTSKYKEQYEITKTRPQYTKEEQTLLELYNVKVDGQRSQLGAVNYQLTQINKRRKQVEGTNTLTETNKKKALQKLDDSQKQIVDKYMEFYRTRYNIDIDKYF